MLIVIGVLTMIRLAKPRYSCEEAVDECVNGITGDALLRQKLTDSKQDLTTIEASYLEAIVNCTAHTIEPINNTRRDQDPVAINTLKKSEMIKIYDQYFVPKAKPARKIYDALLNAAKEKCPFCGGIGTPHNLDHFLPKTYFPQFSILPSNLVPACRDCNMGGKAHAYATSAEDQIIQPYADNEQFFIEQWIYATYNEVPSDEPGEFEYYTSPPNTWSDVDKQRVRKHFDDFNIARRYATKAAELLGITLAQMKLVKQEGLDNQQIITALLQPGIENAPFVNHWQSSMFQALINSLL